MPTPELVAGFGQDSEEFVALRNDATATVSKFHTGTLNIIRAGGSAGLFTAIISGLGSITISPVIKEITL